MTLIRRLASLSFMAALLAGGWLMLRPAGRAARVGALRFEERGREAGLDHRHGLCRLSPKFNNIMPWLTSVGAAVAVADVDGDGRMDVYFTTSAPGEENALMRNRGDGTFEDITKRSVTGVGNPEGASMAAVFGDIDNDGDPDLYVVMWGAPNRLFENVGGGVFRDVTDRAGVGFWGYGNGATFFDYDRDGLPDLLVENYFPETVIDPVSGKTVRNDLWHPVTTKVMHESFTHAKNGGRNALYRNIDGHRFEDVTERAGLTYTGWTLAAESADLDNDGWPDLYMANDFGPDELYFNTGSTESPPRFRSVIGKGPDRPAIGDDWWKGMNVELGDVDGNGYEDIYVTNILAPHYKTDEGNMLWLNLEDPSESGARRFVNVAKKTGTHDGGWGWGAKLADFDNDGRLDIVAVNGFVTGPDPNRTYWYDLQEMVTQLKNITSNAADWPVMGDRDLSGHEMNRLWLQRKGDDGQMAFDESAVALGIDDTLNGRGVALLDADDDGDLDILIANQGQRATFYVNLLNGSRAPVPMHWLGLDLVGDSKVGPGTRSGASKESLSEEGASKIQGGPTRLDGSPRSEPGGADSSREGASGALARRYVSTRSALGARVVLRANGKTQTRFVVSASGFAAQSDPRLFFGLGAAQRVEGLEIHWPSGRTDRLSAEEASRLVDRMTRIVEGGAFTEGPPAREKDGAPPEETHSSVKAAPLAGTVTR